MPLHEYGCGYCGLKVCDFLKITSDVPERKLCPNCGNDSLIRQISAPHTHKDFNKPIEMYSLAPVDHAEILALKQACPDVNISINPNDEMYGVPVARNETERKQVLKAMGFVDKDPPK